MMTTIKRAGRLALAGGFAMTLTACGIMSDTHDANEDVMQRAQAAQTQIRTREAVRAGGVQVSDGVFMAAVEERANASALLPSRVQAPGAVVVQSRDEMTLADIADRLTKLTDIRHIVALGPEGANDGTAGEGSGAAGMTVRPEYRGSLSEVLGEIARTFNVEWKYDDEKIVLRDFITRQYQISSLPTSVSGGASVGGASTSYSTDFWSEIEESIDSIANGETEVSIGSGTGLVTVTARLADHSRIRNYVQQTNANLGQQIAFDVNVLTVSLSRGSGVGINLQDTLFDPENLANIAGNANNNVRLADTGTLSDPTGSANIAILDGGIQLQALVQNLSRVGKVSVDTRAGVTTTNNRAVPVDVTDAVTYISGYSREEGEEGGVTLIPQPATEETGFSLQLFPRILNNREVMVEYSLELSELEALRSFGSGANLVQLPETSSTSFNQQATLRNGQTIVMAGFERTRARMDRELGVSGGLQEAAIEKVSTVIMIRPRILRSDTVVTAGR